jgi:hypothetical protein
MEYVECLLSSGTAVAWKAAMTTDVRIEHKFLVYVNVNVSYTAWNSKLDLADE